MVCYLTETASNIINTGALLNQPKGNFTQQLFLEEQNIKSW